MKIYEIVIDKVQKWLEEHNKSLVWLANKLGVSKVLVEYMLSGRRVLLPKRMEQLAHLLGTSTKELIKDESSLCRVYTVQIRGEITTRAAKQDIDALLFAIGDYIA